MARTGVIATALILACGVSACGSGGEGEVLNSGDSRILVGAEGDGDDRAGIGYGGVVELVGSCLGIDGRTIIWPHGTTIVSDDPLEIDVPELGRIAEGDHVDGGAEAWSANRLPDGISEVPAGCPTEELLAFFP